MDGLLSRSKGPLPADHLRSVYREIFSSSRALQRPQRVAYLGPEGTFSYFAGVEFLGRSVEFAPKHDFEAVFKQRCQTRDGAGHHSAGKLAAGHRGSEPGSFSDLQQRAHPGRAFLPDLSQPAGQGHVAFGDQDRIFASAASGAMRGLAAQPTCPTRPSSPRKARLPRPGGSWKCPGTPPAPPSATTGCPNA